jgi:hypothetical protein
MSGMRKEALSLVLVSSMVDLDTIASWTVPDELRVGGISKVTIVY